MLINEEKNCNSVNDKSTEYGLRIILAAAYFNLSFITNTGHTDVQYDFASCFNYIEYILENNFLFWQENPLLTRPSYSTYHPILHFLLAAGEMRLATVLETEMLNAELPAMGAGANMLLAAEAMRPTQRPIYDIAMDLGYVSQKTFTRVFRREYGRTPSDYRHQISA